MPDLSTPSPPPTAISSSSVDISPPRTIQDLEKNQAKISKHADLLTPKLQRNLQRIFEHNRIAAEHLTMANETISQIRAAQAPLQRQPTKRHVKLLSQDGILKVRDADRSIAARKAKEAVAEEKRLQRQWKKVHGKKPPPASIQENKVSNGSLKAAEENSEAFFLDSQAMR
jgi:predicted nucleic acid-binding Zn ribbon protein